MTTRWSETPAYRDLMRNADEWFALGEWLHDWEIGCAYAAGRASVLGSAEMAVVLKIAEAEADFLREAARYTGPKSPNPRIAAIRAAIEGLR